MKTTTCVLIALALALGGCRHSERHQAKARPAPAQTVQTEDQKAKNEAVERAEAAVRAAELQAAASQLERAAAAYAAAAKDVIYCRRGKEDTETILRLSRSPGEIAVETVELQKRNRELEKAEAEEKRLEEVLSDVETTDREMRRKYFVAVSEYHAIVAEAELAAVEASASHGPSSSEAKTAEARVRQLIEMTPREILNLPKSNPVIGTP